MNRIGWGVLIVVVGLIGAVVALQVPAGQHRAAVSGSATPQGPPRGLVVPVAGVRRAQLVDSWHDAREGGARLHEALDIPAPGGTPVVAAQAGRVEKLFASARGGLTVYVRSDPDDLMAYYAHLQGYADGLHEGQVVKPGDPIGFVGDTGDAGAGNFHLHFALARMAPGERWWQGTPVNPYPLLLGKPSSR